MHKFPTFGVNKITIQTRKGFPNTTSVYNVTSTPLGVVPLCGGPACGLITPVLGWIVVPPHPPKVVH